MPIEAFVCDMFQPCALWRTLFSPPVRWGLLDFMSVTSPPPPPPSPRPSLATKCVQCGVPDLNRDHFRPVWRAGPQPRSCECSVARRTQCQKECQKICRKECQTECQKECQTECQKECQRKICQKECQTECRKECQKICQKECCQICQKKC